MMNDPARPTSATSQANDAESLLSDIRHLRPGADLDLIKRAYAFSAKAHEGQLRVSGDPYVSHCVETARILADLRLDSVTIACGLLHDIVEDTKTGLDKVKQEFGEEIGAIVDGVTHLSEMSFDSPEQEQMEKYRKMLISMARDVRVILIKLADRLHNMRTLQFLPPDDQLRIARETQDVFAPLAHRLGIARFKWELEDLSLKYLDPQAYELLANQIAASRKDREAYIEELKGPLLENLRAAGIDAEITGRPKHFYSVYMKMKNQGRPIEDIFDLLAVRVLTNDVPECYKALGVVHSSYTPVLDRIKDFIATPKQNMYRSLHTTVIGPRGEMVEIQIRTREMHKTAEEGIAAHWRYKEGGEADPRLDEQLSWLRRTLEWLQDLTDPREFMYSLKADLYHDEIFVFTPKGELKNLPRAATPIDFAFAVHTQVGNRCVGAKVNGKLVPLSHELKTGDTVEILTQANAEPSRDWLKIAKTAGARSRIKRWLKIKGYKDIVDHGLESLQREFRKARKPFPGEKELLDVAEFYGKNDYEGFLFAIGCGDVSCQQILRKFYPSKKETAAREGAPSRVRPASGIRVQGIDDILIRFAKCCQPVPGDRVVGVITKGRGISVHRDVCQNVFKQGVPEERIVEASWDTDREQTFPVKVSLIGEDRRSLLADIAKAISDEQANIMNIDMASRGAVVEGTFVVEVKNLRQPHNITKAI
ncbi:MAG TPA: bifunctional (p)ppGpp synthetase/guanosine-3',5'-bis(diphosphate) 3'-pyrophosphohydrolase, partial [bacterium]|nr:bifunctional (p)ppGpp synthetase/guanosine-3',5'-bis(diphosphate) 3'-pyrophosphohydrolase [bacterium]